MPGAGESYSTVDFMTVYSTVHVSLHQQTVLLTVDFMHSTIDAHATAFADAVGHLTAAAKLLQSWNLLVRTLLYCFFLTR